MASGGVVAAGCAGAGASGGQPRPPPLAGRGLAAAVLRDHTSRLTREEAALVDSLLDEAGDQEEALCSGYKVTLRRRDFAPLRPRRWLKDEAINWYLHLIEDRHEALVAERDALRAALAAEGAPPEALPPPIAPILVWNSFFYAKLSEDARAKDPATGRKVVTEKGYCFANVARWTRRLGRAVTQYALIIVPINHGNTHWALAALWPPQRRVAYFDSLGGAYHVPTVCGRLVRWFADECVARGLPAAAPSPPPVVAGVPAGTVAAAHGSGMEGVAAAMAAGGPACSVSGARAASARTGKALAAGAGVATSVAAAAAGAADGALPRSGDGLTKAEIRSQWRVLRAPADLPQQDNGCDCGAFMLLFADWVSLGLHAHFALFGMAHIPRFRRYIALAAVQKALGPATLHPPQPAAAGAADGTLSAGAGAGAGVAPPAAEDGCALEVAEDARLDFGASDADSEAEGEGASGAAAAAPESEDEDDDAVVILSDDD